MSLQDCFPCGKPRAHVPKISYQEKCKRGWERQVHERGFTLSSNARRIIEETAADHGITFDQLRSRARSRHVVQARWDAMYRLRKFSRGAIIANYSLSHIAWMVGMNDHTTAWHGIKQWQKMLRAAAISTASTQRDHAVNNS